MAAESRLRLVSIYPVLLGTYGDGGNLRVLTMRAKARGFAVEATELDAGEPVPDDADLYVLGGGEDDAQVAAARALRADGGLGRAAAKGAVVFGVCAGYQLLGSVFPGSDGVPEPGVELLDVTTDRLPKRAVGELLAVPSTAGLEHPLTGYENHAGATHLGRDARRWPGSRSVLATAPVMPLVRLRVRSRVTSLAPTCTARASPAIPNWPICCSRGRSDRHCSRGPRQISTPCGPSGSPPCVDAGKSRRVEQIGNRQPTVDGCSACSQPCWADSLRSGAAGDAGEVAMVSLSTLAPARVLRPVAPRWLPTWRTTPFAFVYVALLGAGSIVLSLLDSGDHDAVLAMSSTDVEHLSKHPLFVLITSALWVDGIVDCVLAVLVLGVARHRLGTAPRDALGRGDLRVRSRRRDAAH